MEIKGIIIVAEDTDEYWFALGTMFNRDIPSAWAWGDYSFFTQAKSWTHGLEHIAAREREVYILMCRHYRFRRNLKWRLLSHVITRMLCDTGYLEAYCGEEVNRVKYPNQIFFLTVDDSPGYVLHPSIIAAGPPSHTFGAVAVTPDGAQTLLSVPNVASLIQHQGILHSACAVVEPSHELGIWMQNNE